MSKLPNGWKQHELSNFIERIGETFNPLESAFDLPCVELEHIQSETGHLIGHTWSSKQKSIKNRFYAGQILFGKLRPYLRKYLFPDFDGVCSSEIWVLQAIPGYCSNEFLFYLVQSERFISAANVSSGSKMPRADWSFMSNVLFLLPPLPEQCKIAEILSTWDEAIQLVEALIAALKERKRGLMQRLLTGEVRFPGFDDEWDEVHLVDAFARVTRMVSSDIENVLSITAGVGFVDQSRKFGRVIAGKNLERYIHLLRGEFAYNKGNSNLYPQGCIYRLEEYDDGAVPNVYYCFSPSDETIVGDFYRHYFESGALNGKLRPLINSGVRNDGLLNLSADSFFSVRVPVPSPDEQSEIATFLDVVTDEIKSNQQYLHYLCEQKKGLMQRLLTGEVRVRVENTIV